MPDLGRLMKRPASSRGHAGCTWLVGRLLVAVIALGSVGSASGQEKGSAKAGIDERQARRVRQILVAPDFGEYEHELERIGSAANGLYLDLLRNQKRGSLVITRILGLVGEQKGDRSQFLPIAVGLLSHKEASVRSSAALFVGEAGKPEHVPAVVPLLWDKSEEAGTVQSVAADVLAKLGGLKELEALDRRSATKHEPDFPELLADLKKSRDQFRKRLGAGPKNSSSAPVLSSLFRFVNFIGPPAHTPSAHHFRHPVN